MNKKYKLYWLYDNRIENQDPLKDGYIGVTSKELHVRRASHVSTRISDGAKKHFTKLGQTVSKVPVENLKIKEIVWSYNHNTIATIERAFRPTTNIGWNIHPGGKDIYGVKRSFNVFSPDGTFYKKYNTFVEARRDGFNDGNLNQCLKGKNKTFDRGYTAEYC